jgi:hypothetical protein
MIQAVVDLAVDIDVNIISDSIDEFETAFSAYVRNVSRWLLRQDS